MKLFLAMLLASSTALVAACGETSGPEYAIHLTAGDLALTHPGGTITLTASIEDAAKPVEGAVLRVTSDRGEADDIDPPMQQSTADGTAAFTVTTMTSGSATFTLEAVDEKIDPVTLEAAFMGPTLTGDWSFPQPGGVVTAPRAGLVWIDFSFDLGDELAHRELASVALESLRSTGDAGEYGLPLPMHAPRGDLYDPGPEDPELPETFVIAPYAPVIYDDLDGSNDFTADDAVLAVPENTTVLVYAEGELPEPEKLPNAALGYQYMKPSEQDDPLIIPLADLIDKNDLSVRTAPCPSASLSGKVSFGVGLPAGSDTRVAAIMVDADVAFNGNEEDLFKQGNFFELVSADLAFAAGSEVDYQLDLPEPADVFPGYAGFLVEFMPELPAVGLILPLVYVDAEGDDAFTNPDDDLQTGDRIVGTADFPFGYDIVVLEWLDGVPLYILTFMLPGINQGYNLIQEPLKMRVVAVVDDNTLEVDEEVEPGHTGLKFKIIREDNGEEDFILEGDDLDTGVAPGYTVTSASGGFEGLVLAEDELVFLNQIEEGLPLDLDTPYNLKTP